MFSLRKGEPMAHNIHPNQIVQGEYATTMIIGGPARREKTPEEREAERAADRITSSEVLREFRWTAADLELARGYAFPAPVSRYLAGKLAGQSIYSRAAIATWSETLLKFAAKLKSR